MSIKVLSEQLINLTSQIKELEFELRKGLPKLVDGVVKKEIIRLEQVRQDKIDEFR